MSNAGKTTCHRPYKFQGKSIMDLKAGDVKEEYNEKLDTTTVAPVFENTTEAVVTETTTLIDFSKVNFLRLKDAIIVKFIVFLKF